MSLVETFYHIPYYLSILWIALMQRFGEKLHALRIKKKLTLKELALSLGLNAHGYLSEIETGKKKPTAELVLKVARFFDVTTDQLLKDEFDIEVT
jgi:transcriptional regulator with XRE-family HTH domain